MFDNDVLMNMNKLNPEGLNLLQQRAQQAEQTPEAEGFMAEMPTVEEGAMQEAMPELQTMPEEGMI